MLNGEELGEVIVYSYKQHEICSKYKAVISFFFILSNKWMIILLLSPICIFLFRTFFKIGSNFNFFRTGVQLLTGFAILIFLFPHILYQSIGNKPLNIYQHTLLKGANMPSSRYIHSSIVWCFFKEPLW